jgi:hypothetical protein
VSEWLLTNFPTPAFTCQACLMTEYYSPLKAQQNRHLVNAASIFETRQWPIIL